MALTAGDLIVEVVTLPIIHLKQSFRVETQNPLLVEAVAFDHGNTPISRAKLAVLDFAEKLTRDPTSSREQDIHLFRQAGWTASSLAYSAPDLGHSALPHPQGGEEAGLGTASRSNSQVNRNCRIAE